MKGGTLATDRPNLERNGLLRSSGKGQSFQPRTYDAAGDDRELGERAGKWGKIPQGNSIEEIPQKVKGDCDHGGKVTTGKPKRSEPRDSLVSRGKLGPKGEK